MVVTSDGEDQAASTPNYDREQEYRDYFDSKAGVKGLVDSGVKKIPSIFVHNFERLEDKPGYGKSQLSIPVIDIAGIKVDVAIHSNIISRIRDACERWGFFQVVNHGIPDSVMDNTMNAVRRFHEQDLEKKMPYIAGDTRRVFKYNGRYVDMSQLREIPWSDLISSPIDPLAPNFEEVPLEFRCPIMEYTRDVKTLGITLFELLSEALGLESSHLQEIGCNDGLLFTGRYYPPCPEPELTLGAMSHTDSVFMNILLQDQIGGLQVLHQNEWVDVTPLPGALVVNLGDMMQLITNGRFKSANHRVLSKKMGPRISVPCFLGPVSGEVFTSRMYGPVEELLSKENPPIYKKTTMKEFAESHSTNLIKNGGIDPLLRYKI